MYITPYLFVYLKIELHREWLFSKKFILFGDNLCFFQCKKKCAFNASYMFMPFKKKKKNMYQLISINKEVG